MSLNLIIIQSLMCNPFCITIVKNNKNILQKTFLLDQCDRMVGLLFNIWPFTTMIILSVA